MKKSITILTMIILFSTTLKAQTPDNYSEDWYKVESFEIEGLPKSALEIVEKIYQKAKKDKNNPQLIKTLLYKSKFALTLEEDAQLEIINRLKEEKSSLPFPAKNMLESIIADIYWQYFQQNRWKFYNRTNTAEKVDSVDFRTWDLQTIFEETHLHFQESLENSIGLQETDLSAFNAILHLQGNSKIYRPTLYDFLANRAIDFYRTDERNLKRPAYKFEIDNPELLAINTEFTKNQLYAKDSLSQQLHALRLYKNLTLAHLKDKDPTALVTLTLERLDFVYANAVFNNKDEIYLKTLKALKEQYNEYEIVTEIDYKIAAYLDGQANAYDSIKNTNQWKRKEALEVCEKAIARFPKSTGAEKCKALQSQILNPSLQITTEKFIPINKPARLFVNYKNTNHLYFTALKISRSQEKKFQELYQDDEKIAFIKKLKTIKTWNAELKNENDYLQHTTEVLLPELEGGNYMIFTSTNETISEKFTYGHTFLQVTDIALIENKLEGKNIYQVVDRNTGKPLQDAKVNIKNYNTGRYNKPINKTFISDNKGQVHFKNDVYRNNVIITVNYKNDEAVFGEYYMYEDRKPTVGENKSARIFLFSDRSIYRPGQTVHFKGIAVYSENNKSTAIANNNVAVRLYDVNNQEVKMLSLKTNEFASFSGEFVLPTTGLTGNFYVSASGHWHLGHSLGGSLGFSVEEYKRPKFETEFETVTETFRVNDTVTLNGMANAFAGSNITDAKVTYRVFRTAQFPRWCWWYYDDYGYNSESQEITHGETTTDASGNYKIKFKAIPDISIDPNNQPTFNYSVTADVTDINGETRSTSTTVNVGYHALTLAISMSAPLEKSDKNHVINLESNNLNGEFVPTKGSLKIYKLIAPKHVLRTRPWEAPDYQSFSEEEFRKLFPHEAYKKENDPNTWEQGKLVFETKFNTEKEKEIKLKNINNWISGKYIVVAESEDKFKQTVRDEFRFDVFGKNEKTVADNQLLFVKTDKNEYEPNEFVKLQIGSASENVSITLTTVKKYNIVDTKVIKLSNEIKTISIPVKPEDLGGFSIQYQLVNHNAFSNGNININVPYPKNELSIETSTFRDKLQPGQNETWSFKIKGDKKDKVAAEVLASMYDASLDQFRPHNWYFSPLNQRYYYNYNQSTANYSFGNINFNIDQKNYNYYGYSSQGYDQLNWFGFNLTNTWFNNDYIYRIKRKHSPYSFSSRYDDKKEKGYIFGTVKGDSENLAGVNIFVKGTTRGVVTDFDGNFKIKASKGETLVFSMLGFNTSEIQLKEDNVLNITLSVDAQTLDEVVTVGYGIQYENKSVSSGALVRGEISRKKVADGVEAEEMAMEDSLAKPAMSPSAVKDAEKNKEGSPSGGKRDQDGLEQASPLKGIIARKNLQETAFFYPHLKTDAEGNVSFNFTIPESLTRWNLNLLAHTKDMAMAQMQLSTVTQKELMVMPNPPRFLREGDEIVFASKISNLTDKSLEGIAQLIVYDALTDKEITPKLILSSDNSLPKGEMSQSDRVGFTVDAKGNANVSWTLKIPFDVQAVKYKIVAKAGDFTDGEENALPVLSNRMLVTETLPMWLRSNETRTFTLDKLKNNASTSLKHHNLSLEITSNPAWYAVQALPYLMEYPYECSEQTFARYYSNALASHIANSNPRIQEVFNQWKNSDALLSNLEKNQELKSIIIQETPWLRDAQSETEQKKRIALLFDLNKMKNEFASAVRKLEQAQMSNGGFPWFKGARYPNRYITQHIASGFGHLNKLGVSNPESEQMIKKAVKFLDDEILSDFNELKKQANIIRKKAKTKAEGERKVKEFWASNHTHHFQIQYLYMRSFYKDIAIRKNVQVAVDYFTNQAYEFWKDNNLYTKGMISLIAKRNDKSTVADKIIASLKENSITSKELGMYWKENTSSWYWYQAPIETQALLIEAFSEVEGDIKTIDELKVWLLKNKQTNRWKTTKATTEAVYALLLQGTDWLEVTEFVGITIDDKKIDPLQLEDTKVEAGTGYFKTSWKGEEINNNMATVTLSKKTEGVAWGALYWQYFEDLDKITSAKTPLQLSKKLFLKKNTDKGEELTAITENTDLKLGDLVRVRIELKVDRNMEFVHMKDMRAAGFEPVNVLSQYKWQDNLGYYESTKDAATNFFFDYLPKGVYVFEYDLRVNNKGDFSNGITTIQSMYAPEFSSHSEGVRVLVK
ncbi:carboxypeptidase-like regulatory domain-containing protein [Aureibaculum sp. 2210JD6-5]|uniref:alpha-2-macroglobulin family protein n=1 Tax=Aureibaculum sp. 2210JD6-5 TaxID=3103957 RepID=UPI002AAEA63E|nr:MG2 domain-containing protein [Aureibaculum sp. 2210JD6-5]MDY7394461.1 carboxypeptidase-like regulatory domain-containing protein [Aureibaculum sp. 2210JD6-5]